MLVGLAVARPLTVVYMLLAALRSAPRACARRAGRLQPRIRGQRRELHRPPERPAAASRVRRDTGPHKPTQRSVWPGGGADCRGPG